MTKAQISGEPTPADSSDAWIRPAAQPRSAYLHVPFCRHRCGYCDFAIVAGRDELVEPYLNAIEGEVSQLEGPREVVTLYFGGGTPSSLSDPQFEQLARLILKWHPLAAGYEWTVEANPENLDAAKVATLARLGVTRVSLGVQSFNDAKLRSLDRAHTRELAMDAIRMVQGIGLQVAVDLMFAAPGETLDAWRSDLESAISLRPDHVSTYGLTWEKGTAFTVQRDRGLLAQADEDLEGAMYAAAIDALTAAGFEHYEVSNFALSGRRSRHNEAYWAGREYFAYGPGAARYVDGVRETNHRSTTTYIKRVLAGQSPVADREQLDDEARARETLVFGLRRMAGVHRKEFDERTGYSIDGLAGEAISKLVALGMLDDDGCRVRLTRRGLFVSDAIWPELL